MIKNIIFVTTIILGISSQLYSMEVANQESPDLFTIQAENHSLRFRRIDLHNLTEHDAQTLMEQFGDFDAFQSMFGTFIACIFKTVHLFSSETVLDIYTQAYDDKFEKMPDEHKVMYHWIMERDNNSHWDFIGYSCITTYIDDRPAKYANTLMLEIGLAIAKKYRNKKMTTQLAMLVKQKLEAWSPFDNGIFCFSTRTDNEAIHRLAQKHGAELILSHEREVDFKLFKLDEPCDLFVIPKENL